MYEECYRGPLLLSRFYVQGLFFCSIGKHLEAASLLVQKGSRFVLNVPVAGMEDMIRPFAREAENKSRENREQLPQLQLCRPGWFALADTKATSRQDDSGKAIRNKSQQRANARQKKRDIAKRELDAKLKDNRALEACVAHIECCVDTREELNDQVLLYSTIERAWILSEYWTGKVFVSHRNHAPYLAYLGEGRFGYRASGSTAEVPVPTNQLA